MDNSADQDAGATQVTPPSGQTPKSGAPPSSTLKFGAGGLGHSFRHSLPVQDLLGDKLILSAPRVDLGGRQVPALGGIALTAKLGQGGMGAVYLGVHMRLNQEMALKVLPFHLAETQPELIQRFIREAQIAARVHSPHLVRVTDVNDECGLYFLVMEFVHGRTAGNYLRELRDTGRTGAPETVALDICIAAVHGLAAAHAAGVIHRDIKPENIIVPHAKGSDLLDFFAAKLADLGLARSEEMAQSMTDANACMGTPGYMSPEQAADARNCTAASDVFSLGATLYALLTCQAPFTGSGMIQIIMATAQKPHAPIHSLRPEISAATSELLDKCLAKDPAARYADAAAVLATLQACRAALGQLEPTIRSGPDVQALTPTLLGPAHANAPQRESSTHIPGEAPVAAQTPATQESAKPAAPPPKIVAHRERPVRPESIPPRKSGWGAGVAIVVLLLGGGAFGIWKWKFSETPAGEIKGDNFKSAAASNPPPPASADQDVKAHGDTEPAPKARTDADTTPAVKPELEKAVPAGKPRFPRLREPERVTPPAPPPGPARSNNEKPGADPYGPKSEPARPEPPPDLLGPAYKAALEARDGEHWEQVVTALEAPLKETGNHPDKNRAEALLDKARKSLYWMKVFEAQMEKAKTLFRQEHYEDARSAYVDAHELSVPPARLQDAEDGIKACDTELAKQAYKRSMEAARIAVDNFKWNDAFNAYSAALKANPGDANALNMMGWAHTRYGLDRERAREFAEAAEQFKRGAELGIAEAQCGLGRLYMTGEGIPRDYKLALELFQKAAAQDNHRAENAIGIMHLNGYGMPVNEAESVVWFKKAAEHNELHAIYYLARAYAEGRGVPRNESEALKWFKKGADEHSALCENGLGVLYEHGEGVKADPVEAVKWYRFAAEQNLPIAQTNLSHMYDSGLGVNKDPREALRWLNKAVEQNDPTGEYRLGLYYANGYLVQRDDNEAFKWARKAADQDVTLAMTLLADLYSNGRGTPVNAPEALKWYRKAASSGESGSEDALGLIYLNGLGGVAKDLNEAFKWFKLSADHGNVIGQYNLGLSYLNGWGTPINQNEGAKWLRQSAAHGYQQAEQELTRRGLKK